MTKIRFWILFYFILGGFLSLIPRTSFAQNAPSSSQGAVLCSNVDENSPPAVQLGCVRGRLDAAGENVANAIQSEPVKSWLDNLSELEQYEGNKEDLDQLKRISLELKKKDLSQNSPAIAILDNAIASHIGELRPSVSARALAADSLISAGTDIYKKYAEAKFKFLISASGEFYNQGPLENVRKLLLASTLEELYFLDTAEKHDENLRQELKILEDVLSSKTPSGISSDHDLEVNTNRFWHASILFLLGGDVKVALRDDLKKIALQHAASYSNLEVNNDILISKVYNLPCKILKTELTLSDGLPRIVIEDPNIAN